MVIAATPPQHQNNHSISSSHFSYRVVGLEEYRAIKFNAKVMPGRVLVERYNRLPTADWCVSLSKYSLSSVFNMTLVLTATGVATDGLVILHTKHLLYILSVHWLAYPNNAFLMILNDFHPEKVM